MCNFCQLFAIIKGICYALKKYKGINMFFDNLNLVIDYIEENLTNNLDMGKLAGILGTNQDTFKRIFNLIYGISVTEYIKKRRLSVCCADLKDNSVLNVALMYGYNSSAGFSRAFYNFHKCYPSELKQNKNLKLNAFLPVKFSKDLGYETFNYSVETWGAQKFFGYYVKDKINKLPDLIQQEYPNFFFRYKPSEYCGVMFYEKEEGKFWFCLKEPSKDLKEVVIPSGEWLVINYLGDYSEISKFIKQVYSELGGLINCKPTRKIDLELYYPNEVKLCFKLD